MCEANELTTIAPKKENKKPRSKIIIDKMSSPVLRVYS